jgi:hypothetical protein
MPKEGKPLVCCGKDLGVASFRPFALLPALLLPFPPVSKKHLPVVSAIAAASRAMLLPSKSGKPWPMLIRPGWACKERMVVVNDDR